MTFTTRPTYLLDADTLVERSHEVSKIRTQLELPDSGWPGEGSQADVARIQAASRVAWARWMVEVGEIHDR